LVIEVARCDVDEDYRKKWLSESWLNNERRLEDVHNLKAGPYSPLDRIEELERAQDL
jgi:hypothetical protein